ncbi:MAG TPA: hypothetical protein VH394_00230 [Thermoanaerobaculia bacterium]|jgi:hypothetical protein|nr:hypothetical protein [Thermoanaerobaculia bacterium]
MAAPILSFFALPVFQTALTETTEHGYPRTGLVVLVCLATLLSIYRRRMSLATFWIALVGSVLAASSIYSRMERGERIGVLFVLALLVGLGLYQQRRPILQYLFFCRFSLVIGLLLLALPFAGLGPLKALFGNLFVTSAGGVFLITLLAFLASWVVLLTARITAGGAPARFRVPWNPDGVHRQPSPRGSFLQLALAALLALPTVYAVVMHSPESANPDDGAPAGIGLPLLMAFLGLAAALILFYAAYLLGRYLAPPDSAAAEWDLLPLPFPRALINKVSDTRISWASERRERIEQRLAAQSKDVHAGYLDSNANLRPGLALVASFAAITFLVYATCYFLLHPNGGLRVEPPALANVLFMLILLGWILPCLAFFFDRFRVPLLAFLAGFTFLLYFISDIDHYYILNEASPEETAPQESTKAPQPVISENQANKYAGKDVMNFFSARRKLWNARHPDREPVLVAVASSGGGITASLWTAKVLAELQREFGSEFSESIYGLSTVSGGSVGAMYYIDAFRDGRPPDGKSLDQVIDNAGTSSLAATAWGLAYPDFWRGFSLQNPCRPFFDRAWAMEQVWRRTLGPDETGGVPTLRTWRAGVRAGWRPAALFNATIAETGERLVLSPLKLNPLPGRCISDESGLEDCVDARTFTQLYKEKDLPVTTAARLSATFPFVSPITRPRFKDSDDVPNPYHVADGGYYDNYGVVTLIDGLQWVLKLYGKKTEPEADQQPPAPGPAEPGALSPPRKILIVEIRASDSREAKEAKRRAGWAFGTAGPVLTLLNVWNSGQTPRNDLDLQLLKEVARNRGFEVETVLFPLVYDAPLSWHLTEYQKRDIKRGWDWCAAMPMRDGQKSEVEIGLEKARAFLRTTRGWENLSPSRFSAPPSDVDPKDLQDFCLGKKLPEPQPSPAAAQRARPD